MTRTDPAAATSYTLVLPPGWIQLPLHEGVDDAVRGVVDRAVSAAPADMPPDTLKAARRRIEGHLRATVAAARENGGTELYLPVERMGDLLVPSSFVVGVVRGELDADQDAVDVVPRVIARMLAEDDSARPVEIDGAPAVRTQRRAPSRPDQQFGVDAASRRIDYVLAVPGAPGRWMSVSCTVLEVADAPDVTELLVELFDAVMTTFRWAAA